MKRYLIALIAILFSAGAQAQLVDPVPFTFTNGTVADATQVNSNYSSIVNDVNANAAANGANSDITALLGLSTPLSYISGGTSVYLGGTATGTGNAQVVATPVPTGFSLITGKRVIYVATATNTSTTTLNVNGTGALAVKKLAPSGAVALAGGEIVSGALVEAVYDGTGYQLITDTNVGLAFGLQTSLASAGTTSLGTIPSRNVLVTGSTGITSFGSAASTDASIYFLTFQSAITLTYNATSMILPGSGNLALTAKSTAIATYLGSGNWQVLFSQQGTPNIGTPPGGRLTLTTGAPVMTADVTAGTSVFYTPYLGNMVPISNGISFVATPFTELTIALQAGSHTANTNYDVFVVNDAGTIRACTGPAWTSDTGRGTGAGTTELGLGQGIWQNTQSMTCRYSASTLTVAATMGTYVGSIRTTAAGTTAWLANPAAAAGGGAATLYVWNMYNRVNVAANSLDSTDTWNYTTATVRAANGNNANRISVLCGLNEEAARAKYSVVTTQTNAGVLRVAGVGLDSTTAFAAGSPPGSTAVQANSSPVQLSSEFFGLTGLGLHFFQALEYSAAGVGTSTWNGDNGTPLLNQMSLQVSARM